MCANMRKAGKKKAGLWLTEEERHMLAEASKVLGISQSDLLKRAIADAYKKTTIKKGGFGHGKEG